jgi:hypothetical protein
MIPAPVRTARAAATPNLTVDHGKQIYAIFTLLFQLCIEKASGVLAKMQVAVALALPQNIFLIFDSGVEAFDPQPRRRVRTSQSPASAAAAQVDAADAGH